MHNFDQGRSTGGLTQTDQSSSSGRPSRVCVQMSDSTKAASLVRMLALASREVMLAYERNVGMSETRFRVLESIASQNATMAEVQLLARLNQSVVSRMLRSLEEEGVISRADPDAQRDRRHKLTASGRVLFRAASGKTAVFERALTAALSTVERESAIAALGVAYSVATDFNDPGSWEDRKKDPGLQP